LDEALGAGKLANISVIQAPTPPVKNFKKLYEQMAYVLAGGLGVGLAIAFLIELVLDQTVRRPLHLERTLPFPSFLNIPLLPFTKMAHPARKAQPTVDAHGSSGSLGEASRVSLAARNLDGPLKPYCEALRDRLIDYFQVRNMAHKPKLVAVTGCLASAGVSTLAAGLAASLSEIGEGNVLLVDMNGTQGMAYPFSGGIPSCDLNQVLETDRRTGAKVQDNLYVVSTGNGDGAFFRVPPKRFGQLIPKLKASDYDYIIFDMPPVTQTSITGKLAGFMDMVLLVVESEKTERNLLGRAGSLLQESKVSVATILNKVRRYVPRWVHREYE
jgi:Mrp family chromosome partitioning ATPase